MNGVLFACLGYLFVAFFTIKMYTAVNSFIDQLYVGGEIIHKKKPTLISRSG